MNLPGPQSTSNLSGKASNTSRACRGKAGLPPCLAFFIAIHMGFGKERIDMEQSPEAAGRVSSGRDWLYQYMDPNEKGRPIPVRSPGDHFEKKST
jgi:hypothetical protein